ncbi:MAG: TSUP family transporter [Oscillospiraceae bacterium]|nr:TSUP family transporter [Oscillospiraceae bacterium]
MTPSLIQFLILCPLTLAAGYVDAVAGGGGLISLPAYLLIGLPPHSAIASNKLSSSFGTVFATLRYGREGYIKMKLALVCVPMALLGSWCGARLSLLLPEDVFQLLLIAILPVAAWSVLRKKQTAAEGHPLEDLPWPPTALRCALIALVLGAYDGFYGPGTGTFLMLLLNSVARLELGICAGTTKIINLTSNLAALFTFMAGGHVVFSLGIAGALFSAVGNWLGAASFSHKGAKLLRPMIALVLSLLFAKTLWELVA